VSVPSAGTLGYGPPGIYSGFQGFSLKYHLGYGYGKGALGAGAEGGYPFYGGPGYPHAAPCLRRCGHEQPFAYYGSPGFPTPEQPNFYGVVGPLIGDQPVITSGSSEPGPGGDYGCFTGVLPYPEAAFAPFTSAAAVGGPASGVDPAYSGSVSPNPGFAPPVPAPTVPPSPMSAPSPGATAIPSPAPPTLGVATEPAVDVDGTRGLKVTQVAPGSLAEKAGLHAGDFLRAINGYRTEQAGNVTWILANAAPARVLNLSVRTAGAAQQHALSVPLR
jgi:membrane-associated protease RseP (regulator of RpoE activity)